MPDAAVTAYDAQVFPADRPAFLAWLPLDTARMYTSREAQSSDTASSGRLRAAYGVAQALFGALVAEAGDAEVSLEAPQTNERAAELAMSWGLTAFIRDCPHVHRPHPPNCAPPVLRHRVVRTGLSGCGRT